LKETAFPFADSTLKHPAATGTVPAGAASAFIGRGVSLNGTSQYLNAGVVNLGERFTLSAWVKVDPTASTIQTIWANKAAGATTPGFGLFANSYQSKDQKLILETGNGSVAAYGATETNLVTLGQWKHVAVTLDRTAGKSKLYVDGIDRTSTEDIRTDLANQTRLLLGCFTNTPIANAYPFKGVLDEVRIETEIRSSNWIWAAAQNVGTNSGFLSYAGAVQQTPIASASISNNNLALRWGAHAVGFNLYSTTNLSSPVIWTLVTNSAIASGNELEVTLPLLESNRFYQLRLP
jgi:hypothetical protein